MATAKKKPTTKAVAPSPKATKTRARDLRAGVQPSTRNLFVPEFAAVRHAEIAADGGNLRPAAIICDWLLSDDRISGALHTRTQSLLGLDPSFEKSGDKRRSSRVIKALEAGEDWWDSYPETELGQILTWGILLGVAPARHRWVERNDHGGRVLPLPEFWHPQHVRYDFGIRSWFARIDRSGGLSTGSEEPFTPGDGTWLLHAPYGTTRPWAWGVWRGLARLAIFKYLALVDRARASEKGSVHVVTEEAPAAGEESGSTAEQRLQIATDVHDRGREGVVVLPPGFDLDLVTQTAETNEIYEAQVELCNVSAAILIRGGNLTTEVSDGGSRAATESQANQGELPKLRFDAQSITTTIHDQSLVWWAKFNYGDQNLAPWPVYPVEPKKDLTRKAETMGKAAESAQLWIGLGYELDRQKFAEEFEVQEFLTPTKESPPVPAPAPPARAPVPLDDDEIDPNDEDEGAEDDDGPEQRRRFSLASGSAASGFLDGQLYVDALVQRGSKAGAKAVKPTVDSLIDAIASVPADSADPYEALREEILKRYEAASPEALSDLLGRCIMLAELAGRAAVTQDS